MFITVFTTALVPFVAQMNPAHAFTYDVFENHFNIIPPYTHSSFKCIPFFRFPCHQPTTHRTIYVCIFVISVFRCRMSRRHTHNQRERAVYESTHSNHHSEHPVNNATSLIIPSMCFVKLVASIRMKLASKQAKLLKITHYNTIRSFKNLSVTSNPSKRTSVLTGRNP
jgi:hypothetical protein